MFNHSQSYFPVEDYVTAQLRFPMMATIDITKLSKDILDYPNAEV